MPNAIVKQVFVEAFDLAMEVVCGQLADHKVSEQDQWDGFVEAIDEIWSAVGEVNKSENPTSALPHRQTVSGSHA